MYHTESVASLQKLPDTNQTFQEEDSEYIVGNWEKRN